jgi:hypothetical protein
MPTILPKLNSSLHLTQGQRAYMKELGVTAKEFDHLDPVSQHEWKQDAKDGNYEKNRKEAKYFGWNK